MDEERAARRYIQIRDLEFTMSLIEKSIKVVQDEIDEATERVQSLRTEKKKVTEAIREAARDESQLPLFDLVAAIKNGPQQAIDAPDRGTR